MNQNKNMKMTVEQAQMFNNEETRYIEENQMMPTGVKVWHPNESCKNEEDD